LAAGFLVVAFLAVAISFSIKVLNNYFNSPDHPNALFSLKRLRQLHFIHV